MRKRRTGAMLLAAALLCSAAAAGILAYRSLVTELAVSEASDAVVQSVSAIVRELMSSGAGSGLVELEKSADGTVAAVTTDVAAVNTLSAEVLRRAVEATQDDDLRVRVPLGRVLGLRRLSVPAEVRMLSSSSADFRSELESAGINQTRHRITLELRVDVSLFMPWRIVNTTVKTEILVSETVLLGRVPESYLNWENK